MVLEVLKRAFKRVKDFRKSESSRRHELTSEEKFRKCLQPYQRYFFKAQDIIIWENPSESLLAVVVINLLFWLIARSEWRFYSIVCTVGLGVVLQEYWENHLWAEIRVQPKGEPKEMPPEEPPHQQGRLTVPEMSKYASAVCSWMSQQGDRLRVLRETQPLIFCGVSSVFFLGVAGLGRLVSGLGLLYLLAMGLLLLPGLYIHLVPPHTKDQMAACISTVHALVAPPESSVDVEEYMPESSIENMEVFALAGEVNTESNASSSLSMDECLVGSVMPSHEESSMDALDSLSLDPASVGLARADGSGSESEGDAAELLRFKNTHFDGSSSSSCDGGGEERLARNLEFPDVDEVAAPGGLADAVIKNLARLGGGVALFGLLSQAAAASASAAPSAPRPPPRKDSSSDSEFEIIETDDVS